MSKTYVIHWASKLNGRMGTGTTFFEKAEAERLVKELNLDFPDIHHEVRNGAQGDQQVPAQGSANAAQASFA